MSPAGALTLGNASWRPPVVAEPVLVEGWENPRDEDAADGQRLRLRGLPRGNPHLRRRGCQVASGGRHCPPARPERNPDVARPLLSVTIH